MNDPLVEFFVPGTPRPGGSKRAFPFKKKDGGLGVRVTDMSGDAGKDWKSVVALVGQQAMLKRNPFHEALSVEFLFRMPRPKAHYGKDGKVKPFLMNAVHIKKPDVDKLSRSVLDSLKGIVWRDDSIITKKTVYKIYTSTPGVYIAVWYANFEIPLK